jgi:hypothetical protein
MSESGSQDLERLLQSQFSDGEVVDVGTFTLNPEKALEKMASFSFPSQDMWILKVAQAAVLSGAESLSVRKLSYEIKIEFRPTVWPEESFEKLFYAPDLSADAAYVQLKLALWSVGVRGGRHFAYAGPFQDARYLWDGENLKKKPGPATDRVSISVYHLDSIAKRYAKLLASKGTEFQYVLRMLERRACVAPLALVLNDKMVSGPAHIQGYTPLRHFVCLHHLALEMVEGDHWKVSSDYAMWKHHNELYASIADFGSERACQSGKQRRRSGASIVFSLRLMGRDDIRVQPGFSTLSWCRHGVVVKQEQVLPVRLSLMMDIVIDADDLPTDIGGFQLGVLDIKQRRDAVLLSVLQELTRLGSDGLSQDIGGFWSRNTPARKRSYRPVYYVAGALGVATLLGLSVFPAAALTYLTAALIDQEAKRTWPEQESKLYWELNTSWHKLVEELRKLFWSP